MFDRILFDVANAMKNKESDKVLTLRTLVSVIKNVGIEKGVKEYDNDLVISILQKQIKQREDSIEQFKKANRFELVEKEKKEIEILRSYLPTQLTEEVVNSIVDEVILSENATTKKDIGKVMKVLNIRLKGVADMKKVGTYLNAKLL
jgi:uncharacterized protein YqeY